MARNYFKIDDFKCRCDRKECDAVPVSQDLVYNLNTLREVIGVPFVVTSGSRCAYWNEKCGGSETSYHLKGFAVDFKVKGFFYEIAKMAPDFGFNGIGISKGFIHLDRRPSTPVLFGY